MGDPKRHRKKYSSPAHPWQKVRIEEEKQLVKEYGFRNKTEIWKMARFLKDATHQAKKLVTLIGPQADKEKELLLQRLRRYGLLSPEAGLADILSITLRDVLERRLQTQVYKQNLANSVKQARQFITHEHIAIAGKVITSPAYLVPVSEEGQISFRPTSSMSDIEHPERVAARKAKEKASKETVLEKDDDKATPRSRIGQRLGQRSRQRPGQRSGPGARRPGGDRRGGAKGGKPAGRK
jgi:small subunit ribosomal protein S4